MDGDAQLLNAVLLGGGGDGVAHLSGCTEYGRGLIRGNRIGDSLGAGIFIARGSIADVIDNRIDRVGDKRWCIYVGTTDLIAVRGNGLTRCRVEGYFSIFSLQRSQARISDNRGASDTPTITRDKDGIDDTAMY